MVFIVIRSACLLVGVHQIIHVRLLAMSILVADSPAFNTQVLFQVEPGVFLVQVLQDQASVSSWSLQNFGHTADYRASLQYLTSCCGLSTPTVDFPE